MKKSWSKYIITDIKEKHCYVGSNSHVNFLEMYIDFLTNQVFLSVAFFSIFLTPDLLEILCYSLLAEYFNTVR